MREKDKAFICGMSRGGTSWLGSCLNAHPDVAVFGETLFWGRCYVEPNEDGQYDSGQLDQVVGFQRTLNKRFFGDSLGSLKAVDKIQWHQILEDLRSDVPISPGAVFDQICDRITQLEGKQLAIEKTPHHLNHMKRIERFYPDSSFIVMVRDPYSFMLSYKNQGLQLSSEHRKHMAQFYHPIGCALVWKGYARQAMRETSRLGDRALLVRFEQLRADPETVWGRVLEFLNIEKVPLPIITDKNSSFSAQRRPELSRVDVFWMNLISGPAIRELGYDQRSSGIPLLSILGSCFAFVPCVFRVLRDISKRSGGNMIGYIMSWVRAGRS